MSLITWSNDLSVNIGSIDEQHKRLVSLVNSLHDAMSSGKGKEIMGKILDELIEYTKTHFATEERLMTAHTYPGYLTHKKEHDGLTKEVLSFHEDFKSGKSVVSVEIMRFLKDWLAKHIKGTDQKYGPFLISKGVS
ncbi:MAG TPA: bacteriohemerythrin [Thermodesulfovibrionales bacterium]|jgi:hemerythrin|nr:bacteriohemerythrin [Thermodesulfovibrionales bacterium]